MPAVESGRVCMFGAGGPVGAAAAAVLREDYQLRLTDLRDVHEVRSKPPQSPGAPLPEVPAPPHEWQQVDVTDYEQVRAAAAGMDALINTTVIRRGTELAFRVNLLGAFNVMRAAVECGITRIVHTGPRHIMLLHEGDYWYDFRVPDEAPLHTGTDLYALSKMLGGNVVRRFAEVHGLEVVTFLYGNFLPGDGGAAHDGGGLMPFTTSWEDTGAAFLNALRVPRLTQPYEVFDICARLPHGKFGPSKAERLLGWKPRFNFERLYRRPGPAD